MPKGNKNKNKKKEKSPTISERIEELKKQDAELKELRKKMPDLPGQEARERQRRLDQEMMQGIQKLSNPFADAWAPWPGFGKGNKGGKRRRTRRKQKSKKGRKTRRIRRRR